MTTDTFKRRLTAMLGAGAERYRPLMREDEESTIRALGACCRTRHHRLRSGETHQRYGGDRVAGLRDRSREFSYSGAK
ncbi:MAG: hypothetical protein PVI82_13165 [Desulfobacterales bacterium]|jgi:hypothetical protein